jgi:hypothetical protein
MHSFALLEIQALHLPSVALGTGPTGIFFSATTLCRAPELLPRAYSGPSAKKGSH